MNMTGGDAFRGKDVWVTGAAGFIGANLCRALLAAGAEVHAIVRPGSSCDRLADITGDITIHRLDLCDASHVRAAIQQFAPAVILHAAVHNAYNHDAPLSVVVANNVIATANLLDAVAALKSARLVYLGSSTEYGPTANAHNEQDPLNPITRHGATKAAASILVTQQARAGCVDALTLRLFSVYGPWEAEHRLVPSAIHAALFGTVLPLTRPGLRRDYVCVADVAEACLLASITPGISGEVINIGSGIETANEELVRMVEQITRHQIRIQPGIYRPHPTDTEHWVADIRLAKALLGWSPRYSLQEGLKQTVAWFAQRQPVAPMDPSQVSAAGPVAPLTISLSVVAPVYKNADFLGELASRVRSAVDCSYELILVNDASPDGASAVISALARQDSAIRGVYLHSNVGQQQAVLAGLRRSRGDWVIVLDADLQDPPEAIPTLLAIGRVGYEAVFGARRRKYQSLGRMLTSRLYKIVQCAICGVPLDAGMYLALSRKGVDRVLNLAGSDGLSLVGMIGLSGLKSTSVAVARAKRATGRSAYSHSRRFAVGVQYLARAATWRWRNSPISSRYVDRTS
jgi:nucleoside-diphosphate-sugar epimerase